METENKEQEISRENISKIFSHALDVIKPQCLTKQQTTKITQKLTTAVCEFGTTWAITQEFLQDVKDKKVFDEIAKKFNLNLDDKIPQNLVNEICENEECLQNVNPTEACEALEKARKKITGHHWSDSAFSIRANKLLGANLVVGVGTLIGTWHNIHEALKRMKKYDTEKAKLLEEIKNNEIKEILASYKEGDYNKIDKNKLIVGLRSLKVIKENLTKERELTKDDIVTNSINSITTGMQCIKTITTLAHLATTIYGNPFLMAGNTILAAVQGFTSLATAKTAYDCYKQLQKWDELIETVTNDIEELEKIKNKLKQEEENEVHKWLKDIKRPFLWATFKESEVLDMETVLELHKNDLENIGFKLGSIKVLLKEIEKYKNKV